MAAKPNQVQLSFRINDDLHRRLVRAAEQNHTTINTEMKWRIERSFEQDRTRKLDEIVDDLEIAWGRFGERFLELELQETILSALADRNYEQARALAVSVLRSRESNARKRQEKARRDAEALTRRTEGKS
jgi:DNA-binding GntR family transcriptional regulator